jgi:aryl-alcohol dehydrogenase-like predicted oxidoreductase
MCEMAAGVPASGPNGGLSRIAPRKSLRDSATNSGRPNPFDSFTPLEETMQAFADVVRAGGALYIVVSKWTAAQIRAAVALAQQAGVPLVSSQPQYSMLWRIIENKIGRRCASRSLCRWSIGPT